MIEPVKCPRCSKVFDGDEDAGHFWWGGMGDIEHLECPHCGCSTREWSGIETDDKSGWHYEDFLPAQPQPIIRNLAGDYLRHKPGSDDPFEFETIPKTAKDPGNSRGLAKEIRCTVLQTHYIK